MSDTESTTHRHQFECPETARHARPVHDESEHDDFLDTVFGETYQGKHREQVQR